MKKAFIKPKFRKVIVAGLLAFIYCFSFLGGAISNISYFVGKSVSSNASVISENKNNKDTYLEGYVLTVQGVKSMAKKGEKIDLPYVTNGHVKISKHTTEAPYLVDETLYENKLFVEIKNPFGVALTKYDDVKGTVVVEGVTEVEKTGDEEPPEESQPEPISGSPVLGDGEEAGEGTLENHTLSLTPKFDGVYSVQYFYKEEDGGNVVWTSSKLMQIRVKRENISFAILENSEVVMPQNVVVPKNEPLQSNPIEIKLAIPIVYGVDGNPIQDDIILGGKHIPSGETQKPYYYLAKYTTLENVTLDKVSALSALDVKNTYEKYTAYIVNKVDLDSNDSVLPSDTYRLDIDITSSDKTYTTRDVPGTAIPLDLTNKPFGENDSYEKHAFSFDVSTGKNNIMYRLTKNGLEVTSMFYNIECTQGTSSQSQEVEINATASSQLGMTSTQLGNKTYLPKVTAVDANKTPIDIFYYYNVTVIDGTTKLPTGESVRMGRDEKGFYFFPEISSSEGKHYFIEYYATDGQGHTSTDETNNNNYELRVQDGKFDYIQYVDSYNPEDYKDTKFEDIDGLDFEDYSYVVKTKVEQGGTIKIPAIYAFDRSEVDFTKRTITGKEFLKSDGTTVTRSTGATLYIDSVDGTADKDYYYTGEDTPFAEGKNINSILSFEEVSYNKSDSGELLFKYDKDSHKFVDKDGNELTKDSTPSLRQAKCSTVAVITIDKTVFGVGSYSIDFSASDNHSNHKNKTIKFEVVEKAEDAGDKYSAPTVEFDATDMSQVGRVSHDEELKIHTATVTDKIDKDLLVKYYAVAKDGDNEKFFPLKIKDGKVILNTNTKTLYNSDEPSAKSVYELASDANNEFEIRAYAFNDYADYTANLTAYNEEDEHYKNIGMDSYVITTLALDDSEAPTIGIFPSDVGNPVQFSEVKIDGVTFYDNTNVAHIEYVVSDNKGNEYSVTEQGATSISQDGDKWKYEFSGIKFQVNNADADNYITVTYILCDEGRNSTSYSFVLKQTEDHEPPVFVTKGIKSEYTLEFGDTLSLKNISAKDNKTDSKDIVINLKSCMYEKEGLSADKSSYFNNSTKEFTPREIGTYILQFVATDKDGNSTSESAPDGSVKVEVKDTKKPHIDLIKTDPDALSGGIYSESTITKDSVNNDVFSPIVFPKATATDDFSSESDPALFGTDLKLTIKRPKSKSNPDSVEEFTFDMDASLASKLEDEDFNKIGLKSNDEKNSFSFLPTMRGAYTVTYSATDNAGNKATDQEFVFNVGDTTKPTINLTEAFSKKLNEGFTLGENDTLVINSNASIDTPSEKYNCDIYVSDDSGFETKYNPNQGVDYKPVDISIKDEQGNIVHTESSEDGILNYKFTKAGNYTMEISVSDSNRNTGKRTETFTVRAKASKSVDSSTILGTVLIIISVVILIGVVIYFIRGARLLPRRSKVAKQVTKKETPSTNASEDKKEDTSEDKKEG